MTTDHQEVENNAKALLKFALGNHNAKRYQEAAGFYEVILKQYPDTEAAKYAQTNLSSLVNKIDGLEAIWPDKILIARIEQQSISSEPKQNLASPPTVELSKPLPTASKPLQDATVSPSKLQHRIYFKWKQLRIIENPYLLAGLFFLTALTGYFVGREHVKYEIRQVFTGAADGFRKSMADAMAPLKNLGQSPVSMPTEPKGNSDVNKPKLLTFPVSLNEKSLRKSDYTENIEFSIAIDNALDRPIKAFEGRLLFKDVLGKLVLGANMSYRDGMAAKARVVWSGTIHYNQFMSEHREFINIEKDQLVPELVVYKVAYDDGTTEEFPKP